MNHESSISLLAFDWLLISSNNLQMFLLIGSAVLAFALLALTLTRWGHARAVTKCVILSVIAHVLLLGYAYGTRLIFEVPATEVPETTNVHLIGYQSDVQPECDQLIEDVAEEPCAVDEFAKHQHVPDTEPLDRPSLDSELQLKRTVDPIPGDDLILLNPGDVTPEQPQGLDFEPPQVDVYSARATTVETETIQPESIDFERRGNDESSTVQQPEFDDFVGGGSRQEVPPIEIEPTERSFDSFQDDSQRIQQFESEFEVPEADTSTADQFLPASNPTSDSSTRDESSNGSPGMQPVQKKTPEARRLGDGQPVPSLYRLRQRSNRIMVAKKRGGSAATESAVNKALAWLARNQQGDGRWNPRETGAGIEHKVFGHDREGAGASADTGITGLATLAFLAAGHTHLEGDYQVTVQRALEFLIHQQSRDGNLAGNAKLFARMYCHSMALLALSEALAITGDQRLLKSVEAGVDYSSRAQNQLDGGWRYQPGDKGDMSQFGWQVMALHSASIGGVKINQSTLDRMHHFLDLCSSGNHQGLASYRPGQRASTTMTAEALLCRFFMKKKVSSATIGEAQSQIVKSLPTSSRVNLYYWYYGTMAMYHAGGDSWQKWNRQLKSALLPKQVTSGRNEGSWAPDGLWAGYGGRVYSTAMAALCLEVYYRYLPIYELDRNR